MTASLLQVVLDAANYTLILMLVALGLAIVFGLMNVINMAHGEFMMIGAYVVLLCHQAACRWAWGCCWRRWWWPCWGWWWRSC